MLGLALLAAIPVEVLAQAQQGSGSPYSAYGFGELSGTSQVSQALMGGTGIALADPYSVSRISPASYPFLWMTTFETGLVVRNLKYDTEALSARGRSTKLLGLSLGVPFGKGRWGMSLGLSPVSTVGYKFTEKAAVDGGDVSFVYTGTGGLDRAYIGVGHVLWQNNDTINRGGKLSFGANLEYLFGKVEESRKAYYPFGNGYYNTSVASTLVIRSPSGTVGVQYAGDLVDLAAAKARMKARKERLAAQDKREEMDWLNAGKDPAARRPVKMPKGEGQALRFRIGATMELPASLNARHTSLANNFVISSSGVEFPRDTASFIDGAKGTVQLPPMLGLGFTVYNGHWTITAEHRRRDWSQLEVDVEGYGLRTDLAASATYALGASFRPAGEQGGNFLQRTTYRAGVRYASDYLMVNGTNLDQMGASVGLSLPLMGSRTRSRLNLGAEFGQRGTTADGLLRERYADVYIGISITPEIIGDPWFKKRRIE